MTEAVAAAQAEAKLREQEAKYRSVINSIDAGFCIIDLKFDEAQRTLDYRFVELNPAFERQTGLTQPEGQWMRTLAPNHEQYWFDIYGEVALSGKPVRFERPALALQDRWYEVYAFRIGEPRNRQVAILFNDITKRKRSEAALEQAYKELQQMSIELRRSNEDLDQFARVAGHDLRAPLVNIVQFSQLLVSHQKEQGEPDTETKELLGHIVQSGKRMSRLVDDLLRYATSSHGPLTSSPPVWAGSACSQAIDHLRVAIEESGSIIDYQMPADVIVRVELSMLSLVLENLIGNAIHYRRGDVNSRIQVAATSKTSFGSSPYTTTV